MSSYKSTSQTVMSKDYESFTQVVTTGEKLLIPKDYKLNVQYLTNKFVLRDRYKNQWLVEVARDGGQWCIHEGWKDLYSENLLEPRNLVQCAYKGNHVFEFTITGLNGCEKKGVGRTKLIIKEEEIEKDHEEDNIAIDNANQSETEDDDDENEEEPMQVSYESNCLIKSKLNACGVSTRKAKAAPTSGVLRTTQRTQGSTNGAVADCYADDIFQSGSIPRPRNPYFVSRSRASNRKFQLPIPKDVIHDYQIKIPDEFMLVDEKGKKWKTKAERGKNGQLWCTRNWRSLCSANNITKNDACICEFIPGVKQKGLSILVRCVRK